MIFVVIDFVIDLFFFKDRTNKDLEKVQSAFIKQQLNFVCQNMWE